MVSFRDLMYPPITLAAFQALRKKDPKRICFGSAHKKALKDNPSGKSAGFFNVPFIETIGHLFPLRLFENTKGQYGGYYRTVTNDSEFDDIRSWISENADVVFIRSLFKPQLRLVSTTFRRTSDPASGSLSTVRNMKEALLQRTAW